MLSHSEIKSHPAFAGVHLSEKDIFDISLASQVNSNSFTAIDGYRNSEGEKANLLVRGATATESVYKATREELMSISIEDLELSKWIANKGKNSFASVAEQFKFCIEAKLASIEKTLAGDRDDAHRQGHDRCSRKIGAGVVVDLLTEKVGDIMQPVLNSQGLMTVKGIRLQCVLVKKTVTEAVEYKTVNSGSKVLMDNAIEKLLNSKRVDIRTYSLGEGKFEAVRSGSVCF
jgi:hypothetical protein